jgi:hypothetical protein
MGARGRDWVEQHRTYRRIADDIELKYLELLDRANAALDQSSTHLPQG